MIKEVKLREKATGHVKFLNQEMEGEVCLWNYQLLFLNKCWPSSYSHWILTMHSPFSKHLNWFNPNRMNLECLKYNGSSKIYWLVFNIYSDFYHILTDFVSSRFDYNNYRTNSEGIFLTILQIHLTMKYWKCLCHFRSHFLKALPLFFLL